MQSRFVRVRSYSYFLMCFVLLALCIDLTVGLLETKHHMATEDRKLKVKFTLEQATKTQRGCRGIALLIL
jgi:hypothetical protein